ncbi:hypothetical protein NSQ62_14355 [Solibacillus sp. FSL H8-0523]|uniref:hypothetical protein n=1 Tax=Solibacillus sp. FSL H8-0523 TaxID=2954511 RepID=UPI003101A285
MYSVKNIISRFSDHFVKNPDSNIYKFISIFSVQFEEVKETLNRMRLWREIDRAEGATLDLIGENVNQKRGYASDEIYRVLLKSKIARNLSDGSINHMINVIAGALNVDRIDVGISELWVLSDEPAAIKIDQLPYSAIASTGIDGHNLIRLIKQTAAAGVKVDSVNLEGTFEFGDESLEVDASKGFGDIPQTTGGHLGFVITDENIKDLPI